MSKITIAIYRFFKKKPILLYLTMILSTLVFAFFGLQIKYEEDISKLLPSGNIGSSQQLVFNNLKVKDKVFITFSSKNGKVNTDSLILACDAFTDSLLSHDKDSLIDNVLYKLDEELLFSGIEYLYENLALFLDENDYRAFDSIFTAESLDEQMAENYADLESAAGNYTYELIQQDPARLRFILKNKAADFSKALGSNYKIIDGHFFTPDSTMAVTFLSPNFTGFDSKTGTYLVENIEKEREILSENFSDVEVLFHGAPVQGVFNSRQIKEDLLLTMGISLLLACGLIWLCFKNKSTLLFLLLPVGYGMLFALFCLYFMQGIISLMAMGIGAIVLGVALSYCLHVLTHYKYVNDPIKVLREQTKPVILGSITTIGAFMGLLFTDSDLLRDFGLFATFALIGTTFFCLIFLPQFFTSENNRHSEKAFRILEKINTNPFENQKWLVVLLIVISCVCFYTSDFVEFDTNLKNIGYTDPDVSRSSALLSEKTTQGNASLYFAVGSTNLDSALVYNKEFSKHLSELQAQGIVKNCGNTSIILNNSAEINEKVQLWKNYWTDSKIKVVKQNIINSGNKYGFTEELFEPFFTLIESEIEPKSLLDADFIPEGLKSNWVEHTDGNYLVFTPVQISPDNIYKTCDSILTYDKAVVIEPFYYTQDMVKTLNDNFNIILGISSAFVLLVLLISLKSITLSIISFIPMWLSWYIVQGIMAILGIQFNLINIIVSSFIFGVGVDYSIFIMDGLLGGTREKGRLLMQHKTAIFLSAVVLIVSISSLMFATHPAIASIGLTTLIGMSATLLLSYCLQPFIFNLLKKYSLFQKIIIKHNKTFKPEQDEI